jgi:hypothetical protein
MENRDAAKYLTIHRAFSSSKQRIIQPKMSIEQKLIDPDI